MNSRIRKRGDKPRMSTKDLISGRERMSNALVAALDNEAQAVELADTEEELRRQTAIATRRTQKSAQERAVSAIGAKFPDPREDPEELQDSIDELRRSIFVLDAEINDLVASHSMRFPTPTQVANVSTAVGVLEARIAASVAASALMSAATAIVSAWSA